MPAYYPPPLVERITLRDPTQEPTVRRDEYGRPINPPDWGTDVWASRRDQSPYTELAEGVRVRAGRSVFTIRTRDVPANMVVVQNGVEYDAIGAPVRRGGALAGMRAEYLEITCERRSA